MHTAAGGCARAVLVWGGISRGYTYHQHRYSGALPVGLYKILLYCKTCMYESMLFCANTPVGWAPTSPPV